MGGSSASMCCDTLVLACVGSMFRLQASREVFSLACASRRFCTTAESASWSFVQEVFPGAVRQLGGRWATHACLICAVLSARAARLLPALRDALFGSGYAAWADADERVAQSRELAALMVDRRGPLGQLLGRTGPVDMLHLQRGLLHRLCFYQGACGSALALAQLTVEKALGSEWEGEVALDVVRALTRTWPRSGVGPAARALCLEAAARAIAMAGAPELPASQRLLGRALAACAHVRLLSGLPPGDEARIAEYWGDGEAMLWRALAAHERAVELARISADNAGQPRAQAGSGLPAGLQQPATLAFAMQEQVVDYPSSRPGDDRRLAPAQLESPQGPDELEPGTAAIDDTSEELAASLVALGDFKLSVAYCATQRHADDATVGGDASCEASDATLLDVEQAANDALEIFEEAIELYSEPPCHGAEPVLRISLESAEAVRGYGSVILCFFDDTQAQIDRPLTKSLALYDELLGRAHPVSDHVRKLASPEE